MKSDAAFCPTPGLITGLVAVWIYGPHPSNSVVVFSLSFGLGAGGTLFCLQSSCLTPSLPLRKAGKVPSAAPAPMEEDAKAQDPTQLSAPKALSSFSLHSILRVARQRVYLLIAWPLLVFSLKKSAIAVPRAGGLVWLGW